MQPRKNVVEIFSTFLRLEADRAAGWVSDGRLRRRMLDLQEAGERSSALWVLYWHEVWVAKQGGAEAHLTAYLQETCYWVARRMAGNQRNFGLLADFFQIAIVRVPKLLQSFKPEYSPSLKKYAELGFENSLKDWLRVQHQVEICSDWKLLHRLSRKRLHNALAQAGWNTTTISQYSLAWNCYQELAMKAEGPPMVETWTAITNAYNADRLTVGAGMTIATPAEIETWLLTCAKSVRQFLKPTVFSADTPFSDQTSGSPLDLIADSNLLLMDRLVAHEEEMVRSQQLTQLKAVLDEAIASLSPPEKDLLQDYYQNQIIQSDMAKKLGIQQYQVSRQLERVRRSLLKKIILWVQKNLHISPTPSVVESMGCSLELWLKDYGKSET
jgi:RNA polymerase sigma factor (sigma-70 family)